MAKSLRSKRKRKVRAEKRIVNAKKELVKLKEVAAKLHGSDKQFLEANIPDIRVNTDIESIPMSVDGGDVAIGKKALTKINNQWMNQRKIKAIKSKIKKHNKKKSRKGGSSGLSSRKTKKSLKKR